MSVDSLKCSKCCELWECEADGFKYCFDCFNAALIPHKDISNYRLNPSKSKIPTLPSDAKEYLWVVEVYAKKRWLAMGLVAATQHAARKKMSQYPSYVRDKKIRVSKYVRELKR